MNSSPGSWSQARADGPWGTVLNNNDTPPYITGRRKERPIRKAATAVICAALRAVATWPPTYLFTYILLIQPI